LKFDAFALKQKLLYLCSMAKKYKDINQLAKSIVDIATGEGKDDRIKEGGKNVAAVELGRLGGLKGGKARALFSCTAHPIQLYCLRFRLVK
jgi:hypothetical protein